MTMMMDDIDYGMKIADQLKTKREELPSSMVPMLWDVAAELDSASKWPGFNSAHEGYGVLAEEFDELWEHVKVNQKRRDLTAMRAEAIQVAAMALKFVQMIDAGRGRV
jgi:NTP pyrophosphatase (non-canonical NTP hydrolase)